MRTEMLVLLACVGSAHALIVHSSSARYPFSQVAAHHVTRSPPPQALFKTNDAKTKKAAKAQRKKVVRKTNNVPSKIKSPLPVAAAVVAFQFGFPLVVIIWAFFALPGVQLPFNFLDGFYPPRVAEIKRVKAANDAIEQKKKAAADAAAAAKAEAEAAAAKAKAEKAAGAAKAPTPKPPPAAPAPAPPPPPPPPKPPPPPPAPKAEKAAPKKAAPKAEAPKMAAPKAVPKQPKKKAEPVPVYSKKAVQNAKEYEKGRLAAAAKAEEIAAKQQANVAAARAEREAAKAKAQAAADEKAQAQASKYADGKAAQEAARAEALRADTARGEMRAANMAKARAPAN